MATYPAGDPGLTERLGATTPAGYLARLAVRHRRPLLLGVLWASVWMIALALLPAAAGRAVDALAVHRDGASLARWAAGLAGLGVVSALAGVLRHRCAVHIYLGPAYDTVRLVTGQVVRLGGALRRRISTGEVVGVSTTDVDAIGDAMEVLPRAVAATATIGVVAAVLLPMSLPLGLFVLVGVPLLMGLVSLLLRPLHRRRQAYRDLQADLADHAADIASGLRVLRGIGGEQAFSARYRAESQALRRAGVRAARVSSVLESAQVLVPGIVLAAGTWLGARLALDGHVGVGEVVSFYGYVAFLAVPLATLTEAAEALTRAHVAARRVVTIAALRPDVAEPADPQPLPGHGDLHDPATGFTARPGEFTAVAADDPDDAAALADRLGREADGDVTLGGVRLADAAVADVRARILVAAHDAALFAGTLREQLDPLGRHDDREIARALHAACAEDVLAALPGGLDAEVAARGRDFSGGQAQRLRLARALLADPDVLVLVEPTSAVDAHTEAAIARRLAAHRAGRTTIVCATGPLLLDAADRVAHLAGGRIRACAPHRVLLADAPAYAALVTRGEEGAGGDDGAPGPGAGGEAGRGAGWLGDGNGSGRRARHRAGHRAGRRAGHARGGAA